MWNNWAGYVLYFKDFIVVTALVGAAFTIWFAVLTRRFSWKKRNRAIYGALLNRSDRELVCVSAILMQWLFVFSAGDLRYRGRIASSDVPAPDTSCKIGSWNGNGYLVPGFFKWRPFIWYAVGGQYLIRISEGDPI